MPSLKWIQHNGKRILYTDIASQKTEELLDIVKRLKAEIEKEPPDSVLCLCEVTGGKTNTEINQALKEFVKYVDPYVKMITVIGLAGLQTILFNAVLMFTRSKKLTTKNSREEALDWLAQQ
jgi:D-mannonate dehydratase